MNKPTIIFVKGPKDPASDRSGRQQDRRPLQRRHRQSHSERNQMKISTIAILALAFATSLHAGAVKSRTFNVLNYGAVG